MCAEALREVVEPNSTLMDEQLKTSRLSISILGSIKYLKGMVNGKGGLFYKTGSLE